MSDADLRNELKNEPEELLPIERKLIAWSLISGIILLGLIVIFTRSIA